MTWIIAAIVIADVVLFTMIASKVYSFIWLIWAHKKVAELEKKINV